jgi:chromosome segregation ATPase
MSYEMDDEYEIDEEAPTPQPPAQVDGFDVGELRRLGVYFDVECRTAEASCVRAAADHIVAQARELTALREELALANRGKEAELAEAVEETALVMLATNKIEELRTDLAAAQAQIDSDYQRISHLRECAARGDACQADLAAAREERDTLQSDYAAALAKLDEVRAELAAAREELAANKVEIDGLLTERLRRIAECDRYHAANVKLLSAKDAAVAELADIDKVLDESFVRPHRLRRDTMIGNLIDGLNSNHEENVKLETALAQERERLDAILSVIEKPMSDRADSAAVDCLIRGMDDANKRGAWPNMWDRWGRELRDAARASRAQQGE